MKFFLFYLLFFLTCIISTTCKKEDKLAAEAVFIQLNEKGKNLVESSTNFAIDLFKETINSDKSDNVIISPFDISLALAMVYNGADGTTQASMENALGLSGLSNDEINLNFKQISDALSNVDNTVNFSIANSIWYRNDFSVLPDFININKNFYDAEVNSLNFNSPTAKNVINNWVSNKTNNKISTIIDQINPEMVMYLINAIYFKGVWKYRFDPNNNFYYSFNLSDGSTKDVEMITQKAGLKYFRDSILDMIELPYGQGNWAMDLILPTEDYNVSDILDGFTSESWNEWISSLNGPSDITISFPTFRIEYSKELNQVLSNLGMAIAFDANQANFSKINSQKKLFISKIQHKTYIEVNEEGTQAAAVTSVGVGVNSVGAQFLFDRPFLFIIRERTTNTILFIGKIGNPLK